MNAALTLGLVPWLTWNWHHVVHHSWPGIVECQYSCFSNMFILTVNFSTSSYYFHSNLLFFHVKKHLFIYIYICFFPRLENLFSAKRKDSGSLSRTALLIHVKPMAPPALLQPSILQFSLKQHHQKSNLTVLEGDLVSSLSGFSSNIFLCLAEAVSFSERFQADNG